MFQVVFFFNYTNKCKGEPGKCMNYRAIKSSMKIWEKVINNRLLKVVFTKVPGKSTANDIQPMRILVEKFRSRDSF